MIEVTSPLYIDLPKKTKKDKRIHLNLNVYRNLNPFSNNETKNLIKDLVTQQLAHQQRLIAPVQASFTLYAPDDRRRDLANICCIVEKFVSDAIVEAGLLDDDDVNNLTEVHFRYGGVDKKNPRVMCEYSSISAPLSGK